MVDEKRPSATVARLALLAVAAALVTATPGLAWNWLGHRVVAEIAWQRMTPAAREQAVELLKAAPRDADLAQLRPVYARSAELADRVLFQQAAVWSDIVRDRDVPERFEKYHRGRWHYINYFWDNEGPGGAVRDHPTLRPEPVNAVERLEALVPQMLDPGRSAAERAIDLAWVLHLAGDLHQPLHTSGRVTPTEPEGDRGGNLFRLAGDSNLHFYWDSTLSREWTHWFWLSEEAYVDRVARAVARAHPASSLAAEISVSSPERWALEGFELARTIVYPRDLARGGKPSSRYGKLVRETSVRRLALAGYRLAEVLNRLDPSTGGGS